ncbi:RNA binding protein [Zostera marina]|uniref:RNA binding protein n=1 Tax=Zostera marina TaxID=29655 RepID=A0A0K9NSL2_ZOSMR|nr:RNA binding protein [Zostera marina]
MAIDLSSKKRKVEDNGSFETGMISSNFLLQPNDLRGIIEPLAKEQLLDIVLEASIRHPDVLDSVRSLVDGDVTQRKLFIRGLGWDTTTDNIRAIFSSYGELQEAIVIFDKATGKSKGYGFITFMHIDGAILALKEPSKLIDGRMTVTQLASTGTGGGSGPIRPIQSNADVSLRKIFVGNVPFDMPADRLLMHFLSYGEIEEGPLGFDKQTGKSKGYALFVYKTVEGANASLVDPVKMFDGAQMLCKMAAEGKRGKPVMPVVGGAGVVRLQGQTMMAGGARDIVGNRVALGGPQSTIPGSIPGSYPPGHSSFGGFSVDAATALGQSHSLNPSMQSSHGNPGLHSVGGQVGAAGFGGGLDDMYTRAAQFGNVPGYAGGVVPPFQMPPASAGLPSGVFVEGGGSYGVSAPAFQNQVHQQTGSSPGQRVPSRGGGMYQGMPRYY